MFSYFFYPFFGLSLFNILPISVNWIRDYLVSLLLCPVIQEKSKIVSFPVLSIGLFQAPFLWARKVCSIHKFKFIFSFVSCTYSVIDNNSFLNTQDSNFTASFPKLISQPYTSSSLLYDFHRTLYFIISWCCHLSQVQLKFIILIQQSNDILMINSFSFSAIFSFLNQERNSVFCPIYKGNLKQSNKSSERQRSAPATAACNSIVSVVCEEQLLRVVCVACRTPI